MAARVERRGVRGGDHALATAAILIQIFLSPFERRQSVPGVQAGRHTGGIPSVWAWHAPAVKLQTQRTKEKARESRQERDAVRPVMRPAIEAHFRSPTRPTSGVRLVCHNFSPFPWPTTAEKKGGSLPRLSWTPTVLEHVGTFKELDAPLLVQVECLGG
jgi:hypothetical protein